MDCHLRNSAVFSDEVISEVILNDYILNLIYLFHLNNIFVFDIQIKAEIVRSFSGALISNKPQFIYNFCERNVYLHRVKWQLLYNNFKVKFISSIHHLHNQVLYLNIFRTLRDSGRTCTSAIGRTLP